MEQTDIWCKGFGLHWLLKTNKNLNSSRDEERSLNINSAGVRWSSHRSMMVESRSLKGLFSNPHDPHRNKNALCEWHFLSKERLYEVGRFQSDTQYWLKKAEIPGPDRLTSSLLISNHKVHSLAFSGALNHRYMMFASLCLFTVYLLMISLNNEDRELWLKNSG